MNANAITIDLHAIRPSALAELIALLTEEAADTYDSSPATYAALAGAARQAYGELIANAGSEEAREMAQEAGADPGVLFDGEPSYYGDTPADREDLEEWTAEAQENERRQREEDAAELAWTGNAHQPDSAADKEGARQAEDEAELAAAFEEAARVGAAYSAGKTPSAARFMAMFAALDGASPDEISRLYHS